MSWRQVLTGLDRADKLHVLQLLIQELAKEEGASNDDLVLAGTAARLTRCLRVLELQNQE